MGFAQSWQVFVQALKTSYDKLGRVMLTNLLWFGVGFAPFLLVTYLPLKSELFFLAGIVATIFTLGGATAALHHVINGIITGEDSSVRDFWAGFKKFFGRGSILVLLGILGFSLLFFNIWSGAASTSKIVFFLVGFWVWGVIYWYSLLQYVFPLLTQQNAKLLLILKRAALITLDNILASFLLGIVSLIVIVLSIILAAPLLIFTASFLALLQNYSLNEIMTKYQGEDSDPDPSVENKE
ncbi:MAG: DUF624 domain-containing protein [Firmicutes bacterium]|nr:DUF624 domain-containing protein [Bacillota bacterium]